MLGSIIDAEDAVQDTMVRAWRALGTFDGRSSLRSWLYRIATNVCLDACAERARRTMPFDERSAGTVDDELESLPRTHWLEPIPDDRFEPTDADPAERLVLRESVRLAFVSALQHLPAKQRAALLLADVLEFSALEIAETLGTTVPSVNSALQRARATLEARSKVETPTTTDVEAALIDRYMSAFERYDMQALAALLHKDAIMAMPPYTLWLQGFASIQAWLVGRGGGCRGSRLVRLRACGAPAFGHYKPSPDGGYSPWSINLVEFAEDKIVRMTFFLDVEVLFPRFGLPALLPA